MAARMTDFFEQDKDFLPAAPGSVGVSKYKSKNSGLTVYFVDVDSPVINGYFCLGSDQPEAGGIEQLIHHLDSSGGLLPRPMRGEMLRPAWQFHGAENPLADRDQSCYVCCALGEEAFLGTFSCSTYLLQNIEAVMELHGYPYKKEEVKDKTPPHDAQGDTGATGGPPTPTQPEGAGAVVDSDEEDNAEPKLEDAEYYCLSEAGEGAMAWEGTIQAMHPNTPAFWNRLLNDGRFSRLTSKMRRCYDRLYRPDNLTVIVTGTVKKKEHILDVLHDHEADFIEGRPSSPPFVRPWSQPLPTPPPSFVQTAKFICRNPMRKAMPTVCIGWRGCQSTDLHTAMAVKVLSAHLAVGPMWSKLVTEGLAYRISWCQLEYLETCSLMTVHGIKDADLADSIQDLTKQTIQDLLSDKPEKMLKLEDIRAMADRVGWHYIREFESEPFLSIASAIAKAERYGSGSKEQVELRIRPRIIFDRLVEEPIEFWCSILKKYFDEAPVYCTKVLPMPISAETPVEPVHEQVTKEDASRDMNYATTSRRAASRPRRSNNPVAQEANIAVEDDKRSDLVLPSGSAEKASSAITVGLLEEHLRLNPFPFGDFEKERADFEGRLDVTNEFLENVVKGELRTWPMKNYSSSTEEQHPLFPLKDMPMFTFLDDTESSFVYLTAVLDTSHLDNKTRKLLPAITAAIGAFVCPRPPGLDTDAEIKTPTEFNPPMDIADSQVSVGLNGEMMQSLFLSIIVRPEKYAWAVGLLNYVLNESEFSASFLKFIANEAARGLAANYKMQTAEKPNYDCFDSNEINLHSLIRQIYSENSNARLFVGRRRLDLMMEYIASIEKDPEEVAATTNAAWKAIVSSDRAVLQISGNMADVKKSNEDLGEPWKKYFKQKNKPMDFLKAQPTLETAMMNIPKGCGLAVTVKQPRLPCLNIAIAINPQSEDFPKLCMAAQLFTMAQKWIWSCWDLEDNCSPVIRMPCSYANLMTMNLESYDVVGCLKIMKMMMVDEWGWVKSLLTATKLMVVNDPAAMEMGAQGTITSALLSHLVDQTPAIRRTLLKDSMAVTVEDIKAIVQKYLVKFFDPQESCCSLLTSDDSKEKEQLIARMEMMGYKMESVELQDLCSNL